MSIRWYFDFISPFSYLHWQKVKAMRDEFEVVPVPIVFGAVLSAHGQKGPAEIKGKREFTYRHVLWQARHEGVSLRFPPAHPFNPLSALRLCIAAGSTTTAVDAIFEWIWHHGRAGDSIEALAPVAAALGVDVEAIDTDAVKATLRANTDAALAAGVYGVPTLALDSATFSGGPFAGALFWGNDAHDFAIAALRNPALLDDAEMQRVSTLPVGVQRS
jgi:2-hydroxychromene-2-carboxylate isomerase